MNRRAFLMVSLAAAAGAGCQGAGGGAHPAAQKTVDAGPAANYAADGVYPNFSDAGFFIVRRGPVLEAISSACTHRGCKLTAEADRSFYCPCHGSTFDQNGEVTGGPATRNLPVHTVSVDEAGHVIVRVSA